MADVFGSPRAPDDLAKMEQRVQQVIDNATAHFEGVVDRIAPRAIGSKKLNPEESFQDYITQVADTPDPVKAGVEWINQASQQYGHTKAIEMWLDWSSENEKRLEELGPVQD